VRQGIPVAGRVFEVELDVFNVINLLNGRWGLFQVARPRLLEHVGQTAGSPGVAQPIFRYDTARQEWETLPAESAFQFQIAGRYRF